MVIFPYKLFESFLSSNNFVLIIVEEKESAKEITTASRIESFTKIKKDNMIEKKITNCKKKLISKFVPRNEIFFEFNFNP